MAYTPIRLLASVFVYGSEKVRPSARLSKQLIDVIDDDELLPALVAEQTSSGVQQRSAFLDSTHRRQVVLTPERFNAVRRFGRDEDVSAVVAGFPATAAKHLGALLRHFDIRAHRMSVVVEGLFVDEQVALDQLHSRVLQLPTPFGSPDPFEWDWRVVQRVVLPIDGVKQECNRIINVQRRQGTTNLAANDGSEEEFDGLVITTDINTAPSNKDPRFDSDFAGEFFPAVMAESQRLSEAFLNYALEN